jgi:hypothetical protein
MYQTGDLLLTKHQTVLLITKVQPPDETDFHHMLVYDIVATLEEDYADDDLEDYIDWLHTVPWYRYYDAECGDTYWDCEAFMDIEKKL